MSRRCIVYSRVSTDAQERDGTSLDTQEERSLACAQERGWLVVECVRDAASGFSLERPGLKRVRSAVRASRVDVVLVYALDRLSRKQTHIAILAEECADAGVGLEFVTESFEDSATGQFLRTATAFAAELEREKIAERTMRGKAQRARSGKVPQATGRGIYGYDYDPVSGTRRINAEQAAVVQRIFARFCAGGSCHGIAVELRAEGVQALSAIGGSNLGG
ncbi:MAG TPA: recombinase family protein [Dehalococcoidia bacterium]|nr:recombinase family protein [Dehalococcoidia bacterium]